MDYEKCYREIIKNAKLQIVVRTQSGNYFENHHILPKSLGGSNDKSNLVMLTPREHFICHWLLVKMYNKGTNERMKMLFAFWRMRGNPNNRRYVNSRAYEKLRTEFSKHIGEMNKHFGSENSQFGKHWYTNRDTGECKTFSEPPNEKWVAGRNLFCGESSLLSSKNKEKIMDKAHKIWNDFHSGNYSSIRDYCRTNNLPLGTIMHYFKKIPAFSKVFIMRSHNNGSKKEFVNVFEV